LRRDLAILATIRVRLTLWYVAPLSLTLASFNTFLYLNRDRSLDADLDRSITIEARELADALLTDDPRTVYDDISTKDATAPELAALWDQDGHPLAMSTNPPPPPISA
jgi:hypothetical protein